ncbi:MAG TPA: YoaK family protein [Gaiellaceae bacterium]|nr:YoaK family protein [Gaiellaceae bacterium]
MTRANTPSHLLAVAPALAFVAGFVDAVGFLTLRGLFVAHMSGNSVRFGVRAGQGNLSAAAPAGIAVLLFVAGVALGTVTAELAARRRVRSVAAAVLVIQTALIVTFMLYGRTIGGSEIADHSLSGFYVLAALGVVSMGMQTAALRQLGGRTLSTTYVTGVLTSLTQEAANFCFWLHDGGTRAEERSFLSRTLGLGSRSDSRGRAVLLGAVFLLYAGGGIAGSFSDGRIRLWALLIPIALLLAVIVTDLRRPLQL